MLVSLGSNKVDKSEALAVLHEIVDECKEIIAIRFISLDSQKSHTNPDAKGYIIKISCTLDSQSRFCLNAVLRRHDLCLVEKGGYATVFKPAKSTSSFEVNAQMNSTRPQARLSTRQHPN